MAPGPDDIRQQLARIVAGSAFANSERMSAFLRYVVERTLAGEASAIKEYTIGVDVFGRDATYDPRLDSLVRVEARRLRSKLDEYYAGEGAADPVVISLRRGGYVPGFEWRADETGSTAADPGTEGPAASRSTDAPLLPRAPLADGPARRPGGRPLRSGRAVALATAVVLAVLAIAALAWRYRGAEASPTMSAVVLPFAEYSADERDGLLAARLTDEVTSELARLGRLRVVSHTTARQLPDGARRASEIGQALQVDVLVEGSLERLGDRVTASVRLVSAATDRKIWVERFEGPASELPDLARRIAAAVSPAVLEHGRR